MCLLLAAALMGYTTTDIGRNWRGPQASAAITAIALCAFSIFGRRDPLRTKSARLALIGCGFGLTGYQLLLQILDHNSFHLVHQRPGFASLWLVLLPVAALACALFCSPRWRRVGIAAFTILVVLMGTWVLGASKAGIDVLVFERGGATAVIHGKNPYDPQVVKFKDIYGGEFYDARLTDTKTLNFGFPYPPIPLAAVTVAKAITHEVRWAMFACVAAIALTVLLLGAGASESTRRSRLGAVSAVGILMTTPTGWHVLKFAWIEPIVALFFVATVWCAVRRPRALPYALSLFFMTKQYVPLLAPLTVLLVPWRALLRRRFTIPLVSAALLLTLPSLFVTGYWRSVFVVQVLQPFRGDSMSFAAWWASAGHPEPGALFSFAPMLIGLALCVWRAPRTIAGYVQSCAFVLMLFFSFAKQAFPNYHWFAIAALCVAAATVGLPDTDRSANYDGRREFNAARFSTPIA